MKFGFEQNEEFLPTFDKFKDTFSQRKLFLEFFNNQVKKELRFNKQEICSCKRFSLCDIFKQKILRLLNVSFVPFTVNCTPKHPINKPIVFFDAHLQKLLHNRHMPKINTHKQSKNYDLAFELFNMIGGTKLTFKINAQNSFEQFILNKLLKDQKTRTIEKKSDSINIISSQVYDIKIFPYWQMLENSQLLIDEHIKKAVNCIKETSYKNVYLVYPKNDQFYKHIEVKIPEFETKQYNDYGIKLIPYSLRSILK
jgi:hypothetical protein